MFIYLFIFFQSRAKREARDASAEPRQSSERRDARARKLRDFMLVLCFSFDYAAGIMDCSYCTLHIFVSRSREPTKDGVIATFDEHEDSVYAVEWSTADPWVFASLSYDGRLVINRVPRAEKYKILL